MRDHTIQRLRELERAADNFQSRNYGPLTLAIAEHRDAMAAEAERIATAAGARIRTAAGIMLLFDVLVGITTGLLPHRQGQWWQVTETAPPTLWVRRPVALFPELGTFGCLAGWLAHLANPTAQAVFDPAETIDDGPVVHSRAFTLRFPDGVERSIEECAVIALGVPYESTEGCRARCCAARGSLLHHPVRALFEAHHNLSDLWALAGQYTGGAITIPADLAATVAESRTDVEVPF